MNSLVNVKLNQKFTCLDFKNFINTYWETSKAAKYIIIDLTDVEWLSLEGIVFLFGYINYIKNTNHDVNINVKMPSLGETINESKLINVELEKYPNITPYEKEKLINNVVQKSRKRRRRRFLSLMEVWKIYESCNIGIQNIEGASEINTDIIERELHSDGYFSKIVPFKKIDCNKLIIDKNDDASYEAVKENLIHELRNLYSLSTDIEKMLSEYSSFIPFKNKSLSNIITNELILNVAHHAFESGDEKTTEIDANKFQKEKKYLNECYLAIALHKKFESETFKQSAFKVERNVTSERIQETYNFFKNDKNNFQNKSYVEFALVDFGYGIPTTLSKKFEEYIKSNTSASYKSRDTESKILEYAFELDSSRNKFSDSIQNHPFVPRGLFFLLQTVKIHKGLLLVRSRRGRVLYDFSSGVSENILINSDCEDYDFPGTFYSIILPDNNVQVSLKPFEKNQLQANIVRNNPSEKKKYQSPKILHWLLLDFQYEVAAYVKQGNLNPSNAEFIALIIEKIDKKLSQIAERSLIYLDFIGLKPILLDLKLFYYLCNTPKIHSSVNIIVINYPYEDTSKLLEIQSIIASLSPTIFRPIPCIYYNETEQGVNESNLRYEVKWVGLKYLDEEVKINKLLQYGDEVDLVVRDFKDPNTLTGNFIEIDWVSEKDKVGNIKVKTSIIPKLNEINFRNCIFGEKEKKIINSILEDTNVLLDESTHYKLKGSDIFLDGEKLNKVYLTSGGYFQKDFIKLIDIFHQKTYGNIFATYLFNKFLFDKRKFPKIDVIVSVTLSSSLLSKYIRDIYRNYQGIVEKENREPLLIRLAHYYEFEKEDLLDTLKPNQNVLLVNDVISTGFLVQKLVKSIEMTHKCNVVGVFSLIDSRISIEDVKEKELTLMKSEHSLESIKECNYDTYIDSKITSLVNYPILKFNKFTGDSKKIVHINPIINAPSEESIDNSLTVNILNQSNDSLIKLLNFIGHEYLKIGYIKNNHHYHYYTVDTDRLFLSKKGNQLLKKLLTQIANKEEENKYDVLIYPMFSAPENMGDEEYKELFTNKNLSIYPLPRINTPKGWRLTLPTQNFKNQIQKSPNQRVFILDDGSCSGDTLIQMIDFVSFLNVKSITVLSVFGRLEDFEREFMARVSQLATSDKNNPIKLSIYFGCHLRIPFYHSNNCQFRIEWIKIKNKLNGRDDISEFTRNYLEKKQSQLTSKSIYDLSPNEFLKYLPLNNGYVPATNLMFFRNLIGHIEGYRLFTDYFDSIKENFDNSSQKDLEILMGIINHEPYLITTIKHLLPDIFDELIIYSSKFLEPNSYFYQWSTFGLCKFKSIIDLDYFFDVETLKDAIEHYDTLGDEDSISLIFENILGALNKEENLDRFSSNALSIIGELSKFFFENEDTYRNKIYYNYFRDTFSIYKRKKNNESLLYNFNELNMYFNKKSSFKKHLPLDLSFQNLILELYDIAANFNNFITDFRLYEKEIKKIEVLIDSIVFHKHCVSCNFLFSDIPLIDSFLDFKDNFSKILEAQNKINVNDEIEALRFQEDLTDFHFRFLEFGTDNEFSLPNISIRFPSTKVATILDDYVKKLYKDDNIFIKYTQLKRQKKALLICKDFLRVIFEELISNAKEEFNKVKHINNISRLEIEVNLFEDEQKSDYSSIEFKQNMKIDSDKISNRASGLALVKALVEGFDGAFSTSDYSFVLKLKIK